MRLLLVLLGGGAGSVARYLVGVWLADWLGRTFPWGTLAVNVAGSLLIGLFATLADERARLGPEARLLLVPGLLGGFTTFSSFSLETWRLAEESGLPRAAAYVTASLALSFVAVAVGIALGRSVGQ